jgi:hypothetical protein
MANDMPGYGGFGGVNPWEEPDLDEDEQEDAEREAEEKEAAYDDHCDSKMRDARYGKGNW